MQRIIFISFLFLLGLKTQAQTELTTKKVDFVSGIQAGFSTDLFYSDFSMAVTNGVLLRERYLLSIGIGLETNRLGRQIPVFFEGKYLFLKNKKKSPFISLTTGYLQPWYRNDYDMTRGGFTAGVQLGFQNYFSEHVGIATSVGYRYWKQKRENGYGGYYWDSPLIYNPGSYIYISNRLEVRFAILFK